MTYCSNCGAKYLKDARFCIDCGQAISVGSASNITNGDENTSEGQLSPSKLESEETLEENDSSIEVTDDANLIPLKSSPHGTENDVSDLKKNHRRNNKKIVLILLAVVLLLGSLIFFIWNNSSDEPEVWRTVQTEDYPFSINVTIDENRYSAEVIPEAYDYMELYELNNKMILEGEMLPTNNPNSQQVKLEAISFELNDRLISEYIGDITYGFSTSYSADGTIIEESFDEFKKNLTIDWNSQTTKEKKALLNQYNNDLFKVVKSELGYATNSQLSSIKELESYIQEIIDNIYEVDGGLGIKISLDELKEFVMLVSTIDENTFYDSQESLAMINALESLVKFELTDEVSAFVSIPFTNERLYFRKEIQYR